jgi:hypothetical protein
MESLRVWSLRGAAGGVNTGGGAAWCDTGASGQEEREFGPGASEDLCYQPTPVAGCIVQSALEFWQMTWTRLVGTHGACASLLSAHYYTPANSSVC